VPSSSASAEIDDVYDFIHLFPLKIPDSPSEEVWRVADFSMLCSAGPAVKAAAFLKKGKMYEMTDETRTLFKEKLGAFFGR